MMRKTMLAMVLAAWPLAGAAQDEDDRAAVEAVIADQLAQFAERDVAAAWDHASPTIQRLFGSPESFGTMVENGYPMVWDNREARFGELREEAGALRQMVTVEDPDGRLWVLDYEMVELPEGWKINGVSVRPAPDLAA